MNILIATSVLFIQAFSFIWLVPHITLSNDFSNQQRGIYSLISWAMIYLSPIAGSATTYLLKRRLKDALTFLIAIIIFDGLAILLPVAFHWLYWLNK